MKDIFEIQNLPYNLRSSCNQFRRENVKTVHYGIQSVRYLGPKIWELVPNNIKYSNSLSKFKKLIKSWKPEACPCGLCKTYIAQQCTNILPVKYKFLTYYFLRRLRRSKILFSSYSFFNCCYCKLWSVGVIYTHF